MRVVLLKTMSIREKKETSYLLKHRRKWQVKLTIPTDVRWAFENKSTYKRSTGCDIGNLKEAQVVRDRIVAKFKAAVELHRASMVGYDSKENIFSKEFNNRPYPEDYKQIENENIFSEKGVKSGVESWIKERLINKAQKTQVLRYDFWNSDNKTNK